VRGEQPLDDGGEERCGRPLASHVAERERKPAVRQVDVFEEVPADGTAGDRGAECLEECAGPQRLRQQRLLDLRCDLQLLLEPRLLDGLAVQTRVLDRPGRFGRERLERRARRMRQHRALLPAVEIQDPD
jgi:hypothetical protein